jgi:hypothetical protein
MGQMTMPRGYYVKNTALPATQARKFFVAGEYLNGDTPLVRIRTSI